MLSLKSVTCFLPALLTTFIILLVKPFQLLILTTIISFFGWLQMNIPRFTYLHVDLFEKFTQEIKLSLPKFLHIFPNGFLPECLLYENFFSSNTVLPTTYSLNHLPRTSALLKISMRISSRIFA